MEKCYAVIRFWFNPENRHFIADVLRIFKKLDDAAEYVESLTRYSKSEILDAFVEGSVDVTDHDQTYSIIENVLE